MSLYEIKQLEQNGLTAVDLFCGAGVGAYGIKHAGYDILWAVDNDPDAVTTYNLNIGNHSILGDIRTITKNDIPTHDLMIATPVCKPFSVCGARRLTMDKKYGDLLAETMRILEECKPRAFLFENVAGIVLGESYNVFLDFVTYIEDLGYRVYWKLINCWDYGVPQTRERMIFTAIRNDCEYEFNPPEPLIFGKKSQRDAIYDLKDKTISDIKNHNTDIKKVWSSFSVNIRQNYWDEPCKTILSHMDSALCYPEPELPKSNDYKQNYEIYKDNEANFPRKMSVREHLRLQTVGDDFYFPEDISIKKQYFRCSGVPSLITYKWGQAIADTLNGKTCKIKRYTKTKKRKLF